MTDLSNIPQFQRFETSHRLVLDDFNQMKDEITDLKTTIHDLTQENKKLRKDLKESIAGQLFPLDLDSTLNNSSILNQNESLSAIRNLEQQLVLIKKERENAMHMWQNSLGIITQLENELKSLQFKTAPQTMSFELELKQRQEEYSRNEAALMKEISVLKSDLNKKDEEIAEQTIKQNELRLEIESLKALLNQKNTDRRNLIQKEYGYDNALLTLQNDLNDLESKNIALKKDNQYLKDSLADRINKINDLNKIIHEMDHKNTDLKVQINELAEHIKNNNVDYQQVKICEQQSKKEIERLNAAIAELMEEAALKTRQEVDSLKKLYNANLEKLINECSILEIDQSTKISQLEKALRAKKTLESEIEKMANENQRTLDRENSSYEDLHRRLCAIERERDQLLMKLDARENELKKVHATYENDKIKYNEIIADFTDKSYKSSREIDKLADEQAKLLKQLEELREKLSTTQAEKNALQKSLTKEIQMRENESKIKDADCFNKIKNLEENHSRAMFELRQLLNMQQRMSNKWKEECVTITNQSETKFTEMKKNFDNLRHNNEKLLIDLQLMKQKELENEHATGIYLNRIKQLEARVKDAEQQAAEATKRIAKQVAREKMINYEKHLLESDLERTKFHDTFNKGKDFLKKMQEEEQVNMIINNKSDNKIDMEPIKLRSKNDSSSVSSND